MRVLFGDAMSLINGDEAHLCSIDHRNEACIIEAFGRYITVDCQHASLPLLQV